MTSLLAPLALTSVTSALLALPLAPAVLEVWRRRDAAAIPIQQHDGNISNFASSFRRYLGPLLPQLGACVELGDVHQLPLEEGGTAVLVGREGTHSLAPELHGAKIDCLVLCGRRMVLGDRMIFTRDIYAADTLCGGKANTFRAVLGERDLFLGEASRVLRWLHAEDAVYAERNSALYGRLSAGRAVYMWPGCVFERVHAPRIASVSGADGFPVSRTPAALPISRLDSPQRRWRVAGDFDLRAGEELNGNIVGQGEVRIGERCRVGGAIKSRGKTFVGPEAEVDGSLVSTSDVAISGECYVRGPVLAEGEVVIGPGAQVGSAEIPTTVSAPRVRMAPGSLVHGTIWARETGRVGI